ncbi:MAG: hypothetical protein ABI670_08220 [Chloroflexota bacterium]
MLSADCILLIGDIKFELGEHEVAARLFGAAEELLDSLGTQLADVQRDYYESSILTSMRDKLESRLWKAGRYLDRETAIPVTQASVPGNVGVDEATEDTAASSGTGQ